MNIIQKQEEFESLSNGNRLYGSVPELDRSVIQFNGKNNILYCETGIKL